MAPGLHVVPSQSCNSKASWKAKPSLCIKAPTVCLLYGGEREIGQIQSPVPPLLPKGVSWYFPLKINRGPLPAVGNHVSLLL